MLNRFLLAVCLVLPVMIGCGRDTAHIVDATPPPAEQQLRSMLKDLAESGEPLGSEGMVIQDNVEQIRKEDPAKGEALAQHVDGLLAETNPAQVRSKAQAMLNEL